MKKEALKQIAVVVYAITYMKGAMDFDDMLNAKIRNIQLEIRAEFAGDHARLRAHIARVVEHLHKEQVFEESQEEMHRELCLRFGVQDEIEPSKTS